MQILEDQAKKKKLAPPRDEDAVFAATSEADLIAETNFTDDLDNNEDDLFEVVSKRYAETRFSKYPRGSRKRERNR